MDRAATETIGSAWRPTIKSLGPILALALIVRVIALVATSPTGLMNDELHYHGLARKLAEGLPLGDANGRPPGAILMYAGLYRAFGVSFEVARAANVALDVVCVALLFLIGRAFGGQRVGLVAASIAALYPIFIGFSHALWSEPLYLTFALSALALVLAHREQPANWKLVAAGFSFGLGALAREVSIPAAVFVAGWLAFEGRPPAKTGALRAALLLVPVFVVILPWSASVRAETGQFVLSAGTTWFNIYVGNGEPVEVRGRSVNPWSHYPTLGETRREREAAARELSLRAIANRLPWWPFEKLEELRDLFAPQSFIVDRLSTGPGIPLPPPRFGAGDQGYRFRFEALNSWTFRRGAILYCIASYVLLMLCGSAGLTLARDRGGARLFALFMLAHIAPTLIAYAQTRYRLPLMMLMTVTAADLIVGLPQCWRDASPARRLATAAITSSVLAVIVWGAAPPF